MSFVQHTAAIAGEVRTLSLYHVHTKEHLTVTYKVDGRYIPSAMAKLNYFLRDWRKNKVIRMDPKVIDLMWELHQDLGSKAPVYIICGYRSAATNAFLHRIGRHVAVRSQHILGKAIDLYFPDVPTVKLRNSALVREVGGVGYYPRSGPKGFVHVDSGHVRHWPYISPEHLASIMRNYESTIGARFARRSTSTMVASLDTSRKAAESAGKPRKITGPLYANVPKPRPKPLAVLAEAASRIEVVPASAPVPQRNFARVKTPIDGSPGWLNQSSERGAEPYSNVSLKGGLAQEIRQGAAANVPVLRPIEAAVTSTPAGIMGFLSRWLTMGSDDLIRQNGYPKPLAASAQAFQPEAASGLTSADRQEILQIAAMPNTADKSSIEETASASNVAAKADMLVVNRAAKSDFGPYAKTHDTVAQNTVHQ